MVAGGGLKCLVAADHLLLMIYKEGIRIWVVWLGVDACKLGLGSGEGINSN